MNYIAYTIGPIYDTILDSLNGDSKTKRLKAGSYFFSYFMKTLLDNIKDEFMILVPYLGDANFKKIGIYHDRFIASSNKSKQKIKTIFDEKLQKTYSDIANDKVNILEQNMTNHLIIASTDELKPIDKNIIFALNKILDSKELNRKFSLNIEQNFIKQYQDDYIKDSKNNVKNLQQISGDFDYYAVIVADGDKMGTKIKELATKETENIKEISKSLYQFFIDGTDIYNLTTNSYGGELIYAGGDDILAFLPVKKDTKIFLDYIDELNQKFQNIVGDDVSLSFGVNIVYKQYPLREAIQSAFDMLHSAKNFQSNSIAITTTKHSGQTFNNISNLASAEYKLYKKFISNILNDTVSLPHSFHHSLKRYEETILGTYKQNRTVDNLFETIFNDEKSQEDQQGIKQIEEYFNLLKPTTNKDFDDIFSFLSLVKFLREDRK